MKPAREIAAEFLRKVYSLSRWSPRSEMDLAELIQKARNEALEAAALKAENAYRFAGEFADNIAEEIRALKEE